MFWRFGNYTHPNHEVLVTNYSVVRAYTPRRILDRIVKTAVIEGEIIAEGQAAIEARRLQVDTAYSTQQAFAQLLQDDGSGGMGAVTYQMLFPRVLSFTWLQEEHKAHYATALPFQAVIESDEPGGGTGLLSYSEEITKIGNGLQRDLWPELDNGQSIKQTVSSHTNVTLIQSGESASYGTFILPNGPRFPQNLDNPSSTVSKRIIDADVRKVFVTRWNYVMVFNADVALPDPS